MRTLLTVILMLTAILTKSQTDYPKGYFRNPLDIPMNLAGNFGELRPNHYHMGVDIKTQQRENLSVYAAAEGYISRIKIEPAGFGRAIYITHPNGYTTVYAHLNNFAAKIDAYVKQQQYEQESWRVTLDIPPGKFPVKRGEFIAFSGNTGGSQAPHVHFEIRRTADDVNVNPLLFGLPLTDNVPPKILRLAIFDRTKSVYEQTPKIIPVKIAGKKYITAPGIIKVSSPLISLAITAYDTHTGSSNLNGIYQATLSVNDEEVESFTMNNISYNSTRYLNAHIDYKYKTTGGAYLQHLSELPGYINSIYTNGAGHGVLDISDGNIYDITIEAIDTEGNTAELTTKIQYDYKNIPSPQPAGKLFYPLMLDGFESENCEFYIGEGCLYDSIHIKYSNAASGNPDVVSDIHTIGAGYIPLQEPFLVRIKPDPTFTPADSLFIVMQWSYGSKTAVQKVQWQNGWASARFRDFGNFQLVRDTVPPVIVPSGFANGSDLRKATRIVFTVKDNLPGVKNVRAELDGKWLRFTNDKGGSFIYYFDEKCLAGNHVLQISAEDEAGNKVSSRYSFIR
ncbi:MAG: M23 family metallopeptidase [Chitinophagaceae bacterium]|nr:M23 family metallopeptidase [Chitinophagaceae bacterium]